MALIHVNESDFREQVLENSGTVLVDFWANWCGPCRMLGPVLEQLAADRPDVTVAKVDVDENMSLAAAYGVESIPMLLVFKNGQLVNSPSVLSPSRRSKSCFSKSVYDAVKAAPLRALLLVCAFAVSRQKYNPVHPTSRRFLPHRRRSLCVRSRPRR